MRCRNEEQVRQWETAVKRLIQQVAARRASDRSASRLAYQQNSTNPALARMPLSAYNHEKSHASMPASGAVPGLPSHPYGNGSRSYRQSSPYTSEEQALMSGPSASYSSGPQGYPPHDGFEMDEDFDEYSVNPVSGRATPLDNRRGNMTPGLDRDSMYDRPRAFTEYANGAVMSQWRNNPPMMPPPPPINGLPSGPSPRPPAARLNSNLSSGSYASSEASFGPGPAARQSAGRPQLRSQFSSTRLRSTYENGESRSGAASPQLLPNGPPLRSRSASQPTAYVPKAVPPPLPSHPWDRTKTSTETKRSSGSSHSTNENSEYSPNTSSPITPFASSDSSLAISGRAAGYENGSGRAAVKVKVHFGTDIFVIQVARATQFRELVEKIGKKIRLCGPRREDGPLRVKYEDEEGDHISMRSTEDVEMAFAGKSMVTLHVAYT